MASLLSHKPRWTATLAALRRAPWLLGSWLLALVALALLLRSFWPVEPLARQPGFAEAAVFLAAQADDDLFVVLWPPHVADALERLPEGLRAADAVPQEEEEDARRVTRIAVMGPAGFNTPPELRGVAVTRERRFDAVEIRVFAYATHQRLLFDLRSDLEKVRVRLHGRQSVVCDRRRGDGGWSCPGRPSWNHVSPHSFQVRRAEWQAVWAHPVTDDTLILDLGKQPLGDHIDISAALSDGAARTPAGATVYLDLEIDGARHTLVRSNAPGVARLTIPTGHGERAHLRLRIHTPKDDRRHFGVNLRIVEATLQGETVGGAP